MNELDAAAKHIYDTLLAHDALTDLIGTRVYELDAPDEAVYPFVVYSFAGGTDRQVAGADQRMITRPRYLVLACHDQRDMATVRAIANALDDALTGSTADVTLDGVTYAVQTVRREEPVERGGDVNGVYYVNAGGYYRAPTQKLP